MLDTLITILPSRAAPCVCPESLSVFDTSRLDSTQTRELHILGVHSQKDRSHAREASGPPGLLIIPLNTRITEMVWGCHRSGDKERSHRGCWSNFGLRGAAHRWGGTNAFLQCDGAKIGDCLLKTHPYVTWTPLFRLSKPEASSNCW